VTINYVTWPQVTGSDSELTSFDRKSPESCWIRQKNIVYFTYHILQGCSSKEKITWQEMTWCDLTQLEVTRKWSHLTGSHLKVAVEVPKLAYTLHFISYKAVARRSSSRDEKWHHVTAHRKWRHLTGSHLEAAVEGRKLAYTVHFTFYKAVTRRRRQSREGNDITWPQVTASVLEVTLFERKSPASGSKRLKTGIYCTFHFLQGCSSQDETATWQEMTSCDLRW